MTDDFFYLISIDPGSNIGVAIYKIRGYDLAILGVETLVIPLENFISPMATDKLLAKLRYLESVVQYLSLTYNPLVIAIEEAFLNIKFPLAVMQLSQYLAIILNTFNTNNPSIKIFKYAPRYVKRMFDAGGNADKNAMTLALSVNTELSVFINPMVLCEHEIDAAAIGYVALAEVRMFPLVLYALC